MALSGWSTTAADNASVGSINFSENQSPNTVNDSARALMADVRTFYENLEWRDWGHTVNRTSNTTFEISSASDLSSIYTVGRRIRCTDSLTLYGNITVSSYAASTQTVTVSLDSGNLSASLTAVALGLDPTNKPWGTQYYAVTAYRTTSVSISNNTYTDLSFTSESFDSGTIHDNSTNPYLFEAPSWATKMRMTGLIRFAVNAMNTRGYRVLDSADNNLTPNHSVLVQAASNTETSVSIVTGLLPVTGGTSYKIQAFQNSGGALNVEGASNQTYVTVEFFA